MSYRPGMEDERFEAWYRSLDWSEPYPEYRDLAKKAFQAGFQASCSSLNKNKSEHHQGTEDVAQRSNG